MAIDVVAKKNEEDQLVRKFPWSIDMTEKQIVKTVQLVRKTDETTNMQLLVSFNKE